MVTATSLAGKPLVAVILLGFLATVVVVHRNQNGALHRVESALKDQQRVTIKLQNELDQQDKQHEADILKLSGQRANRAKEVESGVASLSKRVEDLASQVVGMFTEMKDQAARAPRASYGDDIDDDTHVIFSTGCNMYQQWQSELLLFSHVKSGQKGKITRIVSGCDDKAELAHRSFVNHPGGGLDKIAEQDSLHKSLNPNFDLHFTPAYEGSKEFPWFNKPFSIEDWAKKGKHNPTSGVVVILDPDEIFLGTVTQHPQPLSKLLYHGIPEGEVTNVVKPKRPVAQMYGLGGSWVNKFDRNDICGQDAPCTKVNEKDASNYYSVGPPLMIHMADIAPLSGLWAQYMRPVFKITPGDILTDMWAYIMGAANLEMPHVRLDHFMVSDIESGIGEGWRFVDEWESSGMSCDDPQMPEGKNIPTFLHFAHNYRADDKDGNRWMFHKGHVPGNILDCDVPILKAPPDDLYRTQTNTRQKRSAWMLCNLYSRVNGMLKAYKKKFCPAEKVNLEERVRLVQSKSLSCDRQTAEAKGWCYPLAQVELLDKLEPVEHLDNYGKKEGIAWA